MNFSKRMGYEPEKTVLQFEIMDDGLKMAIHNTFRNNEEYKSDEQFRIYKHIWETVMEEDIDKFATPRFHYTIDKIKEYYFGLPWNKVYDYVEWYLFFSKQSSNLEKHLNFMLEFHNSAYRIVDKKVIPISNDQELAEVSQASHTGQKAIDHHMQKAIEIFSKKETKDYRNTIKEAISAVEATVKLINGSSKGDLSAALNKIQQRKPIHPALFDALNKLYAYSSDGRSGVRHSIFDGSDCIPDFADAKFMLVACSAFINYLLQRQSG
jgi:soluble cytochrome b562